MKIFKIKSILKKFEKKQARLNLSEIIGVLLVKFISESNIKKFCHSKLSSSY